jgi:hypothetical protein
MGRTATATSLEHEAILAVVYCLVVLVVSIGAASSFFGRRTSV